MNKKKGMDKNLLAKSTLSSLDYSPERIKISFNTRQPSPYLKGGVGVEKDPAPHLLASEGLGNRQPVGFANNQFVSLNSAPEIKSPQTFSIILPNLIHKSKTLLRVKLWKGKGII